MGKIKKLKSNELVGGVDREDVYPITSTKAVFDDSNTSQDDINKNRLERIEDLEETMPTTVKSITINGGQRINTVDKDGNVDLTIYSDGGQDYEGLTEVVADLRDIVGENPEEPQSGTLLERVDTLEEAVGTGGSVDQRIENAINDLDSQIVVNYGDANPHIRGAVQLVDGKLTRFELEENDIASASDLQALDEYTHSIYQTKIVAVSTRPTTGEAGIIYRVPNSGGTTYTDWMYSNGWKELATFNIATLNAGDVNYDNSQSGLAAENVQGALDEVDGRTIIEGNGKPFGLSIPYMVGSNGKWVNGSVATHYLINVGVGNSVKITSNANQGVRYVWLKNNNAPSNNDNVHWSDIDSGIHVIDIGQSQLATAPADAGYLYLLRTASSNNYTPASVVKMESIKSRMLEIAGKVNDRTLVDGNAITLGTAYSCIAADGIWKSNGTTEHCLVAVSAGDSYKITPNSSYNANCCWLTSAGTPSSGTVAPFSQIDGTTYIITIGQPQIITAPEDAAFLCVNTKYNGNVLTPSSVVKMEKVNDAIEGLFGSEDGYDFVIKDENKNAIVAFKNGHILTKNFNSENALKGDIRKSDYLIYRRQLDNEFVHNNVGMIGDWVKRTLNNTPVVSTYSWGSQLVFKVRGTTSVVGNFIPNSTDTATIGISVDNGSWSEVNMTSAVTIASGMTTDEHIIRIMSMNPAGSSTMYSQGTGCVNFDSLVVDEGAIVTPLTTYNRKILFIGDSITAGASKLDAWKTYSYKLSNMLFSQPVQCCAPSSGLVSSYTSWVPTTMQILRNLLDGYINYINEPDIIFINIGTNDSTTGASFTTAYSNMLSYLRNRFGGCYIFACSPFNGTHLSDTSAAIEGFDNITWIDTTALAGKYSTSDGIHPDNAGALTCAEFCYDKIVEVIDLNYFN